MQSAVKINNLSVTLGGNIKALKNIGVELPSGKIVGIIGPSGAGKTTLIRSIVGRIKPTAGRIEVLGLPAGTTALRNQASYMTQDLSIYPDLTVNENLIFFAKMYGQPKKAAGDVIKAVDLTDKSESLVSDLSGGQKQRVSLAVALISSPPLMVLDEPTVGLDPVLRNKLWNLFNKLAGQGITLIVTSHSMDEAGRCDDLVLLRDGKVLAHNTPAGLKKQTGAKTIEESFLKLVGAGK